MRRVEYVQAGAREVSMPKIDRLKCIVRNAKSGKVTDGQVRESWQRIN
jgi:hypothetical protein